MQVCETRCHISSNCGWFCLWYCAMWHRHNMFWLRTYVLSWSVVDTTRPRQSLYRTSPHDQTWLSTSAIKCVWPARNCLMLPKSQLLAGLLGKSFQDLYSDTLSPIKQIVSLLYLKMRHKTLKTCLFTATMVEGKRKQFQYSQPRNQFFFNNL